jgi:uncharacterized membrane protein
VPAATAAWPLVVFCACTESGVASLELLLIVKLPLAQPEQVQRKSELVGTLIVPRFWVLAPL